MSSRLLILKNIITAAVDTPAKTIIQQLYGDSNPSKRGFIFESICEILVFSKCIQGINYTEIQGGQLQKLHKITNVKDILKNKINTGNNPSDITIKNGNEIVAFSIKYKNTPFLPKDSDIHTISAELLKIKADYKCGLIVKDKNVVINHRYNNTDTNLKAEHDKVITNNLIFDENDIITGLSVFKSRPEFNVSIDKFIELINTDYLLSPRKQLSLFLHQKVAYLTFVKNMEEKIHLLQHKPRSGKSITLLLMSKHLLEGGSKKILIMTAVPATINSFKQTLENYIDFKDINYIDQDEFFNEFETGIVFCSLQFFKVGNIADKKLQHKFDAIIMDECHIGGSSDKTKKDVLLIDDIRSNIKINIFASATANKTLLSYNIKSKCVYNWTIEDEAFMKSNNLEYIKNQGPIFNECYNDTTINRDYSTYPIQCLMKHRVAEELVDKIVEYNLKHETSFGLCCSSLLELTPSKYGGYKSEFAICETVDGEELLHWFFNQIISPDKMNKKSVMKQIEIVQTKYESRKSSVKNPKLFIMYLPLNTGDINKLQQTLQKLLTQLWSEYNIEYSNSKEDSSDCYEEYDQSIITMMEKTRKLKKKGCILLLGNKGATGITYHDCDVTISLDDGHSVDNQRQKLARSMTEAQRKTIGINVDMNIQRSYMLVNSIIQKYKTNTKFNGSAEEVLTYLYNNKIFLFNPQEFESIKDMKVYYKGQSDILHEYIDDSKILENFECGDKLREIIKVNWSKNIKVGLNSEDEGEQQDCPKGKCEKEKEAEDEAKEKVEEAPEEVKITPEEIVVINATEDMCKTFMFPLLALISRTYKIYSFQDVFSDDKTKDLIKRLVFEKLKPVLDSKNKIDLNDNIFNKIKIMMTDIIENSEEIIDQIREIYTSSDPSKIRELIAKHFIPSLSEKKKNAEIPTPVKLVDEMLNKIRKPFWTIPRPVFEPCCGKGNFVLGIFDRFYKGLKNKYPVPAERCKVIIEECLYYADITAMNVFITTEILKCHIQSYSGDEKIDVKFNSYVGDTLKLKVDKVWGLEGFDAVIGNPPYNKSKDESLKGGYGGRSLWDKFVVKSLDDWVNKKGYLVFVHPPSWRKPEHYLWDVLGKKQILYLKTYSEEASKKIFDCSTIVDYYVLENTPIYKDTILDGQDDKTYSIDLREWNFLPSGAIDNIKKILGENKVIYSRSLYGTDKKNMSKTKTSKNKLPVVHNMTKRDGLGFVYSSEDKGQFGIPKVILSFGRHQYPYNDWKGEYGMSQICYGIKIKDKEEGDKIVKAINSDKFKEILKYTKWSTFQTDWRMFKFFKPDFWSEFL